MKPLEVKNLQKSYGKIEAVKDVSFEVRENEIFGLVGPNGAGKSTILKIIATVLNMTGGQVLVYGEDIAKNARMARRVISYLPEEAGAYKTLSGNGYLKFMAAIYTDSLPQQREFVTFAQEISGLKDRLRSKIKTYSKGMARKLLLARAVMSRPKLAILDEPTSGLDVINAFEIRRIIKRLAQEGMAVLLSSHNMLEIEFLSDRVALINKGEIEAVGTPEELKERNNAKNLEEVFVKVAM